MAPAVRDIVASMDLARSSVRGWMPGASEVSSSQLSRTPKAGSVCSTSARVTVRCPSGSYSASLPAPGTQRSYRIELGRVI